jgi:hypothetical protein
MGRTDDEECEVAERCVGEGGYSDAADKVVCDGSDASSWIGSKAGDKRGERRGDSRGENLGESPGDVGESPGDVGDSRGGVPGSSPFLPGDCSCSEGNSCGETLGDNDSRGDRGDNESVIPVELLLLVASASNSLIL